MIQRNHESGVQQYHNFRDVIVPRSDWSRDQKFGLGLESLVLVLRLQFGCRSRRQNFGLGLEQVSCCEVWWCVMRVDILREPAVMVGQRSRDLSV